MSILTAVGMAIGVLIEALLGGPSVPVTTNMSGIIGSIISWILNRAKEVIGWLSQNLWALITGVGVLIYTYS